MKKLIPLIALSLLTSGCAVATAGIKKGDERNFVRSMNDVSAGRVIEARMKRAHDYDLGGIDVEVMEGVALLSGNVPTQADKIEAVRIAWSAQRIDQVGNEIMIKDKQGFVRNTKDGFLEKSVRTRMTADKLVKARNYSVETHDGIVYLMGVARTQLELERAASIAATTKGTREVISYVRIADLPAQERLRLTQEANSYLAPPAPQRAVPDFLTTQPMAGAVPQAAAPQQMAAPIQSVPLSEPIPFNKPTEIAGGPTAPAQLDMGDKLGKELPTDEQLGSYRTGQAGDAISVIESPLYYVDPDTGKEIPVRFDANGNLVPILIK